MIDLIRDISTENLIQERIEKGPEAKIENIEVNMITKKKDTDLLENQNLQEDPSLQKDQGLLKDPSPHFEMKNKSKQNPLNQKAPK